MQEEVLRDPNGRRIGTIETKPDGTRIIRDRDSWRLGEYDPKSNITRNRDGRRIGEGDLLARLLHR